MHSYRGYPGQPRDRPLAIRQRELIAALALTGVWRAGGGLRVPLWRGDARARVRRAVWCHRGTFILLCAAAAWYSVGYPAGYTLIAMDRNREFLAGALVAGVANITLNLALIPLAGIEGAGIATLGAFVLASLVWLRARRLPRADSLRLSSQDPTHHGPGWAGCGISGRPSRRGRRLPSDGIASCDSLRA